MLKSRPVVTMAGVSRYFLFFLGQDGRVFKAPINQCRERAKYTPDKRGIEILLPQESPYPKRLVLKNTSRRYYGWHRPNLREQDGRVVKAPSFHCRKLNKYTPNKRGIEILSLKKDHKLGGWR